MVGLCLVLDGLACQPGKQLIDVSNALNAPELLSISLESAIQWMVGDCAGMARIMTTHPFL